MKKEPRKKRNSTTVSSDSADLRAEIAMRAHETWLNEGGGNGCHLDHWLRVERELGAGSGHSQESKSDWGRRGEVPIDSDNVRVSGALPADQMRSSSANTRCSMKALII